MLNVRDVLFEMLLLVGLLSKGSKFKEPNI